MFSLVAGFARFVLGAHSLDQVVFGWMMGVWIALTYFSLVREYVHKHVLDLVYQRFNSQFGVYYGISAGVWAGLSLINTITYYAVRD